MAISSRIAAWGTFFFLKKNITGVFGAKWFIFIYLFSGFLLGLEVCKKVCWQWKGSWQLLGVGSYGVSVYAFGLLFCAVF